MNPLKFEILNVFTHVFKKANYRIPGHFIYMSLYKKATVVIHLVLQITETYVNEVAGYSVKALLILEKTVSLSS